MESKSNGIEPGLSPAPNAQTAAPVGPGSDSEQSEAGQRSVPSGYAAVAPAPVEPGSDSERSEADWASGMRKHKLRRFPPNERKLKMEPKTCKHGAAVAPVGQTAVELEPTAVKGAQQTSLDGLHVWEGH